MIHFAVVTGTPDAVEHRRRRLEDALRATRFFDGEYLERVGTSRTWALAAVSMPDPICPVRLAVDGDAMAVINGPALAVDGAGKVKAPQLLRKFRSGGTPAVSASLGGNYNFVGITPERGARAFGDFSGMFPLYFHQAPDCAVLSNRSTTVAHVVGTSGWDLRALAWVIGYANLFGEQMPARDVAYLPPGREVRAAWGDGAVNLATSPTWLWPTPDDGQGREDLTSDEWDEVTESLVANFRALRPFADRAHLSITGGKDSRLCLALAKAAGLADSLATFTSGAADSPEVACAEKVAVTAGFSHERRGAPAPSSTEARQPPPFDADAFWNDLRRELFLHESILCPWSGLAAGGRPGITIKGFGGELYRRGNARQFRRKHTISVDAFAGMFVNYHKRDPLDVLRRKEAAEQAEWLRSWVYETAAQVRLDLLPEKFYVDYRLGHWNGPPAQSKYKAFVLNPLLSSTAAKKNVELAAEPRRRELFHFEVMRRAAPELVGLPFLKDTWAPELAASSPIELAPEPWPTTTKDLTRTLTMTRPSWPFLEHESAAIVELFREAGRQTDLRAICKLWRLRRVARKSPELRNLARVKELFSSIGAALTLLDRTEPVVSTS